MFRLLRKVILKIPSAINNRLLHPLEKAICKFLIKRFVRYFYSEPYCHGQGKIICGRNCSLGNTIFNARSGNIRVGDNVSFGHNVMVLTGIHDYRVMEGKKPTLENAARDVEIGDNVWVASGAIIIGPVKIGKSSVVAAGSVVVKDVPEGVLVAGNPAAIKKHLGLGGSAGSLK